MQTKSTGALLCSHFPFGASPTAPADFLSLCRAGGWLGRKNPPHCRAARTHSILNIDSSPLGSPEGFRSDLNKPLIEGSRPEHTHRWAAPRKGSCWPRCHCGCHNTLTPLPLHPQASPLYTVSVHGGENNCSGKIENTPLASGQSICIFGRGSYFFLRLRVRSF